jgi:hypothetical protein
MKAEVGFNLNYYTGSESELIGNRLEDKQFTYSGSRGSWTANVVEAPDEQ